MQTGEMDRLTVYIPYIISCYVANQRNGLTPMQIYLDGVRLIEVFDRSDEVSPRTTITRFNMFNGEEIEIVINNSFYDPSPELKTGTADPEAGEIEVASWRYDPTFIGIRTIHQEKYGDRRIDNTCNHEGLWMALPEEYGGYERCQGCGTERYVGSPPRGDPR